MTKEEKIQKINAALARTLAHPCRGAYARSAKKMHVRALDPDAVCWCALGALKKEFNVDTDRELHNTLGLRGDYEARGGNASTLLEVNEAGGDLAEAFAKLVEAL
jgi:hypothetical protein